jgi:esterase
METSQTLKITDRIFIAYRLWRSPEPHDKPPLVMIHGAASNMTRWTEFVEQTRLTSARDILCLDLSGHGQSLYRGPIGLEIWCDDITEILRQEGYHRVILAGHCLGANVAVKFAARYPQQTAGLILIEPMLRSALVTSRRRMLPLVTPLKILCTLIRLLNRVGIYRRHLASLDLRALDREFRAHLTEPGGAEALARRYASPWDDLKSMPSANFIQDMLEVVRPLPLEKMSSVPFLAILSAGSTFVDPDITRALLKPLPRAEIVTLDAQHWIPTEQPHAMRDMIEAWVNSQMEK